MVVWLLLYLFQGLRVKQLRLRLLLLLLEQEKFVLLSKGRKRRGG